MIQVTDLHAEYVRGAVTFVATSRPRLTWRTLTTTPNWTQASAELRVTRSDWVDSENHRVERRQTQCSSAGRSRRSPYESGSTAAVRVPAPTARSPAGPTPITVEAAFLDPGRGMPNWWRHPEPEENLRPGAVHPGLHRPGRPVAARLRTTAHGVYQAEINSAVVSDDVLAPGWTSYDERLLVQTADVTALLRAGATGWPPPSPRAGSARASGSSAMRNVPMPARSRSGPVGARLHRRHHRCRRHRCRLARHPFRPDRAEAASTPVNGTMRAARPPAGPPRGDRSPIWCR